MRRMTPKNSAGWLKKQRQQIQNRKCSIGISKTLRLKSNRQLRFWIQAAIGNVWMMNKEAL